MAIRRVAFLSSEYPPHTYGGLGTTVEALSRFLAAAGVEVVLLVPAIENYAEPTAGVTLVPVPVVGASSSEEFWLIYCEAALDAVYGADFRIDLVHAHDWMTAAGGVAMGRMLNRPVVLTIHLPQVATGYLALENVGLLYSNVVIANSEAVRAELSERELDGTRLVVIPNGVDLARYTPGDQAPNPMQILYVGRLVPQKGVDVLLRAFSAVLRRHPDATLLIAGDGEQGLYFQRLARFLGVRQQITFLGWRSHTELAALYQSSAVVAVPSRYEPFGLVALEAMASGRPVVAGRVGGLAEIIEDEVSGYLTEPGDHLDLAARLAALLSQPEQARATGVEARRRAERFDWAMVVRQTIDVYQAAADQGPPPLPLAGALTRLLSGVDPELCRRVGALLRRNLISPELRGSAQ
jgi:glycosyltransferase involved in cell wall biosynthesis